MKTHDALELARHWTRHDAQPDQATLRAVVSAMLDHIDGLSKVATGEVSHVYNGACPDSLEGPNERDPDCPVCTLLKAASEPTAMISEV